MALFSSDTLGRVRIGVVGAFLAFILAACGSVGISGGPNNSVTGITPPTGTGNTPPQISGSPAASVIAGNSYSFTPTASDADNDTLTFSVTNLPDWASFDPNSGTLSGTPPPASIGSYPNISISVSDGQATSSLAPFAIRSSHHWRSPAIRQPRLQSAHPIRSSRRPMRRAGQALSSR